MRTAVGLQGRCSPPPRFWGVIGSSLRRRQSLGCGPTNQRQAVLCPRRRSEPTARGRGGASPPALDGSLRRKESCWVLVRRRSRSDSRQFQRTLFISAEARRPNRGEAVVSEAVLSGVGFLFNNLKND